MKKLYFISILTLVGLIPTFASSHTLGISGDYIAAVMHISPNDVPNAGIPSFIHFEFRNTSASNHFTLANCNCMFAITQSSSTIFSQALSDAETVNPVSAKVDYTFPHQGTYSVAITGTPKDKAAFKDFTLSYDIQVNSKDDMSHMYVEDHSILSKEFFIHHGFHLGLIIIASIVILISIFTYGKDEN